MLTHSNPSIKKQIYDRISFLGTVSKADLMNEFSLTPSSMTRFLEEMTNRGLLVISGLGNSTGGRKPILFQTNPKYRYILGLEISRIYSVLGLYDMHLTPLSLARWKMDEHMTPEVLADLVTDTAKRFLHEHGITSADVLGLGIGAVGPLDHQNGIILEPEWFPAPSWRHVPICAMLEERLGIPAQLDNGANTALIGEHWALRSDTIRHALYVHVGVNIRSAAMSEGRILRGAADTEGAIGQMIIQMNGPKLRNKGNSGALEAFVSVPALEDRVRAELKSGRSSVLSSLAPEQINFATLVDALSQDDPLVKEQFQETAVCLGTGLANLINALHPEYVVLGGPLINAHPLVFDTAVEVAKQNAYHYPQYNPLFTQGQLTESAVATGAALMVLQRWSGD
ncbi:MULTISPECIES: ROK family protein [Paenibacillus]|jgi:predicted NBD/HSP70 family sugar kinase|uniref:Sugar kinase of the NBD/HSP70 family, may contain an N-terminal HTH domain n=1 Tax=Paenibacillus barengoltzii J12 TaxID=935846 RepID=A0ABY1LTG7_9BACL|nr:MULTISPECIES: ROK family protein [Paenibacillus]MEC2345081.1 ROK family protein [Paenibacillus barengoltzii]SME99768.1 Sugar kinase of the NBD/HSP70 family, may contain an N-terminal HTH domain [Paenibacillus barengoltzii J12]SMF12947.1 Sugar kinase of the NBD/HSP70 family, may contain an N-terminal HTH domain [Paenibacillus barengoltzii]